MIPVCKHVWSSLILLTLLITSARGADAPKWVVYEGGPGPGCGKNVVLVAGDHEYRSEETLPALAQILSKRYGFRCTVLFSQDEQTGEIIPGHNYIPGLEALKDADLLVLFTRFLDLPDDQMRPLVDYIESGRPIVALRTATHAFYIKDKNRKYFKYSWRNPDPDYQGGFGRQVLGVTWEDHWSDNHKQSTAGVVVDQMKDHPIVRGVENLWAKVGAYEVHPGGDSQPLMWVKVLDGMQPDSPPMDMTKKKKDNKTLMPLAWIKTYQAPNGKTARTFTATLGASEDFQNEGVRRLIVNACLWAAGLESKIPAKSDVRLVSPMEPSEFGFDVYKKGMYPADFALAADTLDDTGCYTVERGHPWLRLRLRNRCRHGH